MVTNERVFGGDDDRHHVGDAEWIFEKHTAGMLRET